MAKPLEFLAHHPVTVTLPGGKQEMGGGDMFLNAAWAVVLGVVFCAPTLAQENDATASCASKPPPSKGRGAFVRSDCARFEGEFSGGELFGPGRVTYQDGRVMEGNFQRTRLNGKGKASWPDGRRYEGYFRNGRSYGFGAYTASDGSVFEGKFRPGAKLHGWGTRSNPDGSTLIGEYREGEPFGEMLLVKADGSREAMAFSFPAAQVAQAGSSAEQKPRESPAASITKPLDDLNSTVRTLRGIFGK